MTELITDLQLVLKIAENQGLLCYEQFGRVRINVPDSDDYYYDPIKDDALCHQLMIQYGVTFHPKVVEGSSYRFRPKGRGPYARCGSHEPIHNENPNTAICLAIYHTYCQ